MRKVLMCVMALMMLFVLAGCEFSCEMGGEEPQLVFCEDVVEFEPVNISDTFEAGSVFFAHIQNHEAIETDNVLITAYLQENGTETEYERAETAVEPEWDTFTIDIALPEPGDYRISFAKEDGTKIVDGNITIQ